MEIRIDIRRQKLILISCGGAIKEYDVSTGMNGVGQKSGSGCTPLGVHTVAAMIGKKAEVGAVFVSRRPTGEIYSKSLSDKNPERDWILTRILWLDGLESGINRGGDVDTMGRFIYIHGTPDSEPMGIPLSHGCIRMRNMDVIELFDFARVGMLVRIMRS